MVQGLLAERPDDERCVLAAATAAARMLAQGPTRGALLAQPEVAARFAALLQHPAREVARAADAALDAVAAGGEEWAASVRRLKFESFNGAWLAVVHGEEAAAAQGGEAAEQPSIGAYWEASSPGGAQANVPIVSV